MTERMKSLDSRIEIAESRLDEQSARFNRERKLTDSRLKQSLADRDYPKDDWMPKVWMTHHIMQYTAFLSCLGDFLEIGADEDATNCLYSALFCLSELKRGQAKGWLIPDGSELSVNSALVEKVYPNLSKLSPMQAKLFTQLTDDYRELQSTIILDPPSQEIE